MIGFLEKDKGCREKEKVARLVDNLIVVVDRCLTTNAPLLTSLTAYHCKACVFKHLEDLRFHQAQKAMSKTSFAFPPPAARQGKRARFCLFFLIFVKLPVESFEEFCLC